MVPALMCLEESVVDPTVAAQAVVVLLVAGVPVLDATDATDDNSDVEDLKEDKAKGQRDE